MIKTMATAIPLITTCRFVFITLVSSVTNYISLENDRQQKTCRVVLAFAPSVNFHANQIDWLYRAEAFASLPFPCVAPF